MSFTHTLSRSYKTAAGTVTAKTSDQTADTESNLDTVVSAGATNFHRTFSAKFSLLRSFLLYSSKAITVKTNSSGAPDQTFILGDGQAIIWNRDDTTSNPVTDDITDLYFTNAGASDATVKVRALIDQPGAGS